MSHPARHARLLPGWLAAVCAVVLLAPDLAHACSVCPLGSGRTGKAYLITGLLISATQLIAVGSLVWWWRRRVRQAESGDVTDPT